MSLGEAGARIAMAFIAVQFLGVAAWFTGVVGYIGGSSIAGWWFSRPEVYEAPVDSKLAENERLRYAILKESWRLERAQWPVISGLDEYTPSEYPEEAADEVLDALLEIKLLRARLTWFEREHMREHPGRAPIVVAYPYLPDFQRERLQTSWERKTEEMQERNDRK